MGISNSMSIIIGISMSINITMMRSSRTTASDRIASTAPSNAPKFCTRMPSELTSVTATSKRLAGYRRNLQIAPAV